MNPNDMPKCSMIAAYHQMSNARSDSWHHFEGDPLFGGSAKANSSDAAQKSSISERRPHRSTLAVKMIYDVLRLVGWKRPL